MKSSSPLVPLLAAILGLSLGSEAQSQHEESAPEIKTGPVVNIPPAPGEEPAELESSQEEEEVEVVQESPPEPAKKRPLPKLLNREVPRSLSEISSPGIDEEIYKEDIEACRRRIGRVMSKLFDPARGLMSSWADNATLTARRRVDDNAPGDFFEKLNRQIRGIPGKVHGFGRPYKDQTIHFAGNFADKQRVVGKRGEELWFSIFPSDLALSQDKAGMGLNQAMTSRAFEQGATLSFSTDPLVAAKHPRHLSRYDEREQLEAPQYYTKEAFQAALHPSDLSQLSVTEALCSGALVKMNLVFPNGYTQQVEVGLDLGSTLKRIRDGLAALAKQAKEEGYDEAHPRFESEDPKTHHNMHEKLNEAIEMLDWAMGSGKDSGSKDAKAISRLAKAQAVAAKLRADGQEAVLEGAYAQSKIMDQKEEKASEPWWKIW